MSESVKKSFVIFTYFVLILSTFLVFRQVRNFEFVSYDDSDYVYENPHVLNGLTAGGAIWAFTTGHAANWHPLTWLSLMLDCQLSLPGGANPGWIHLVNLFLHLVNTLLLFAVLKKMTGSLWPSAFVAAAFAIHPMHVESVAWIAERKDVLSTFFLLLTLASYVGYVKRPSVYRYILSLVLFALGLMAKPMLVTLPFLLLLLDYWPLNRIGRFNRKNIYNLVWEKIPFFVLSVISSVITFLIQRSSGAVISIDIISLNNRIANAFLSYAEYMAKMFWPRNLAAFYPFNVAGSISFWQVVMCALLLIGISVFVVRLGRNQRYLPVGWFWYLGTLIPVIGIVQVGSQAYADRYTYIPYIGLFLMLAWGLPQLLSKWISVSPQRKIALGLSMVIVLTTLGICAHRQASYWKNNFTLFSHAIEVTPNNWLAHNSRGVAYNSLGRYKEAIEDLSQAIRIKPDYAEAYTDLGIVYSNLGRYNDAIDAHKQAIRIRPYYAEAHNNLGNAYDGLGRDTDAIEAYKQAIRINPDLATVHYNLGVAYRKLGRYPDAVEAYKQAIRIKPDYADAYINLGVAYGKLGRYPDAVEVYKQAIRIKPDVAMAHYNLGVVYLETGDKSSAIEEYKILKTLDPELANKLFNLINK
jgi:tetratricopeptide (TPR) repeat protein